MPALASAAVAAILLLTARAPVSPVAAMRALSVGSRCDMVRAVLAPGTFDELDRYVSGGCAQDCILMGRMVVEAEVLTKVGDGRYDVTPLFTDNEICRGQGFTVMRASDRQAKAHRSWVLHVSVRPLAKRQVTFGLSVMSHPADGLVGMRMCTTVGGLLVRTRHGWQPQPLPKESAE